MRFRFLRFRHSGSVGVIAAAVFLAAVASASGSTIITQLDEEFTGGTSPSGPPPWLQATFKDVGPNSVEIRLMSLLNGPTEFVNEWMFNLNPAFYPAGLTFTPATGSPFTAVISTGVNEFRAGGGGFFDIQFDWPQNPMSARFNNGDVVAYLISSTTDLISAKSFSFFDFPGPGNTPTGFVSAAKVQGIGPQDGSGWIGGEIIPEPATLGFLGLGSLALLRRPRRNSRAG